MRYSKLAFRTLVSRYETHITTTPMILAKEFSRTEAARHSEFLDESVRAGTYELLPGVAEGSESAQRRLVTNKHNDTKGSNLYQQESIASGEGQTHAEASREAYAEDLKQSKRRIRVRGALVASSHPASRAPSPTPPSSSAASSTVSTSTAAAPNRGPTKSFLGSYLLRQPETVRDMVRAVKARMAKTSASASRYPYRPRSASHDALCGTRCHAGASVLQIHGRNRWQSSAGTPVDLDGISFAVDAANACGFRTAWGSRGGAEARFADGGSGGLVPCVGNGDVWTLDDAIGHRGRRGVRGR